MQATQPWNVQYSLNYRNNKLVEPHRSLMHDLMHITKAVGVLSSIAEWADHEVLNLDRINQEEYQHRIADLIMCAIHISNHPPIGYHVFDLEEEVISRTETVNKVINWESHG